jgi:HEAT repeat protein
VEIIFCDRCDASVPPADIERGAARQRGGLTVCAQCLALERRKRLAFSVLAPIALIAAGALGAVAAVFVTKPRIDALETRLAALAEADEAEPAGRDRALLAEMRGLREVDREQSRAIGDLRAALERTGEELSGAIRDVSSHLEPLESEVRAIKDHLVRAGGGRAPEPGAPSPGTPGPEAPPREADEPVDIETWLPLVGDDDPGVRLSALVALEKANDERVTSAALEALADPDSLVRAQAAQMLGDRKEERAIPGLVDLLADDNVRVRAVAGKAVAAMAGTDFGYDPTDPEEVRAKAVESARAWAKKYRE